MATNEALGPDDMTILALVASCQYDRVFCGYMEFGGILLKPYCQYARLHGYHHIYIVLALL